MAIIAQDYTLTTRDSFTIEQRREALRQFVFNFQVAIDHTHLSGQSRNLNYLSIETLFPEHNESLTPLLLADQLRNGFSIESLKRENLLRRIYQLGRSSLCVRCVPDYEQGLDELQFLFHGGRRRDIIPAVRAIEGVVKDVNYKEVLDWYSNE